jgi:hypothetical protein
MKTIYRNCIVESKRETSLDGSDYVYYSAYTNDGYEICCDFTESNVREGLTYAKFQVDEFLDLYDGDEEKHSIGM